MPKSKNMNAVVFKKYGGVDVLKYETIDVPTLVGNQVLIRVKYASVNPVDWKVRNGIARVLTGIVKPKSKFQILGADIAGEIEAVGSAVSRFEKGDKVCAILGGIPGGGYAEQVAVDVSQVALMPQSLDFQKAAALPLAGLTAFQALKMGNIQANQNVLINGASGGVGIFAVQIAKAKGANVTAVCSERNANFVRSLGADKVIDYNKKDFTKASEKYDIIYDAVGKSSLLKCKSVLSKSGVYITTMPEPISLIQSKLLPYFSARRVIPIMTKSSGEDLAELGELVDKFEMKIPIEKEFPLKEVAKAHEYSQSERVRGKLILKM
jgi:NADPH:quinone reductase-like Zn-dependent oxidoreductase